MPKEIILVTDVKPISEKTHSSGSCIPSLCSPNVACNPNVSCNPFNCAPALRPCMPDASPCSPTTGPRPESK